MKPILQSSDLLLQPFLFRPQGKNVAHLPDGAGELIGLRGQRLNLLFQCLQLLFLVFAIILCVAFSVNARRLNRTERKAKIL